MRTRDKHNRQAIKDVDERYKQSKQPRYRHNKQATDNADRVNKE